MVLHPVQLGGGHPDVLRPLGDLQAEQPLPAEGQHHDAALALIDYLLKEGQGMGASGYRDHIIVCGWNSTST